MSKLFVILLFLCIAASGGVSATEPLHDLVYIDGKTGLLLRGKCCWVDLPHSEALDNLRISEVGCSAIGGPRGKFNLTGRALTLVSLYTCGGDVELGHVYPASRSPMAADWISGEYHALMDPLCRGPKGVIVYGNTFKMMIRAGKVIASDSEARDASACEP